MSSLQETAGMESVQSKQKSELDMDLKLSSVTCHSNDILVTFQGLYVSVSDFDYHILQKEIQLASKRKENIGVGEFCLIQEKPFGTWNRGRVLERTGGLFEVLLIDQGNKVKVSGGHIASACADLFTIPPKVVNGIFSNILPIGEKWTPKAINYFSSLQGLQVKGHVQTSLKHHVILLETPKVISHAVELGLARYIDSDSFCFLVDLLYKLPTNSQLKQMPNLLQPEKPNTDFSLHLNDNHPSFQKILRHLKPNLALGTAEKVKISAALSPDRFYCQIFSWEEELINLTASMTSHYETMKMEQRSVSDNFGVLCAAKRRDGLWYRGVIYKLISGEEMRVWFMDVGSYEIVSSSCVQKLQSEFLSLPMMAVPCSLANVNGQEECIRNIQLMLIKQGLLGQTVIASVDQVCDKKCLYYITLFDRDHELSAKCLLSNKLVPTFSPSAYPNISNKTTSEKESKISASSENCAAETEREPETISYKTIQMEVDSIHVVYVEYVLNPSNFWIRTDECQYEFAAMMEEITKLYNACEPTERILEDPKPGQLCCALYAKDGQYYRAVVTEVMELQIAVYFLDFGNTETVDSCDVKTLPPRFSVLPALAMCCTLAYACPVDDVWVKSANDFFKQTVSGKALFCHVLAKQKYKYVVDIRHSENSENSNIVMLMVNAGFAEYWKVNLNAEMANSQPSLPKQDAKSKNGGKQSSVYIEKHGSKKKADVANSVAPLSLQDFLKDDSLFSSRCYDSADAVCPISYKQYVFKPGTMMEVACSQVNSPGDFWCHQQDKTPQLNELMESIQAYYTNCKSLYRHGQIACVARNPTNGRYYRASVAKHVSGAEVEVLFVDFGNLERVSVSELREIKSQFLQLEGQAFRCSLSNIAPVSSNDTWTSNACMDFKRFIAKGSIKCTIYALFSSGSTGLCNGVHLETSCNDVSQFLVSKGHAVFSPLRIRSFNLHAFCYSDFDVKVGHEVKIYVTHVYSTGRFYCQLAKNTQTIESLAKKVTEIGEHVNKKDVTRRKKLCVVKYFEDGNFYRALMCPLESSSLFLAFFVDFGDSQMVSENEMLPIPDEATDVLFEPMQAIQCYLFGLKDYSFTNSVKKWFEDVCIGKMVRALVRAKTPDGELGLDLYGENILINAKIKELVGMTSPSERTEPSKKPNCEKPTCGKTSIACNNPSEKRSPNRTKACEMARTPESQGQLTSQKGYDQPLKFVKQDSNGGGFKHSNQSSFSSDAPRKSTPKTHGLAVGTVSGTRPGLTEQPSLKTSDLPQVCIKPGTSHVGYVSHINSPFDFYIQLGENEQKILMLAEALNNDSVCLETFDGSNIKVGELVVAQYPDDMALYRAKVTKVDEDNCFEVEFIDYGNTAIVDSSRVFMLPKEFLKIPQLSIQSFLGGVHELECNGKWKEDVVAGFSELVTVEPLNCLFISIRDSKWDTSLTCKGQSVAEELLRRFKTTSFQQACFTTKENGLNSSTDQNQNVIDTPYKEIECQKDVPVVCPIENNWQVPDQNIHPGQLERVKHIYTPDDGKFFVILEKYSQESNLTLQIEPIVRKVDNRLAPRNITEGMVCLAKSSAMQTWLRASVEKVFPKETKMLVFFIDRGASETISMHNAKVLTGDILSIPRQAIACRWVWAEKTSEMSLKSVLPFFQKRVLVLFLDFLTAEDAWKVEVLIDSLLLMEYIADQANKTSSGLNSLEPHGSSGTGTTCPQMIPVAPLQRITLYSCFVIGAYNPSDFYLQLEEDSVDIVIKLWQAMRKLSDNISSLPHDALRVGTACLFRCFKESEWCRSKIVKITGDSILLNLFDYGVAKRISYADSVRLKVIPEELARVPSLAYRCTLHGVSPSDGTCWSTKANELFTTFVEKRNLMVQVIKTNPTTQLEVCLYGEGEGSLAHKLVSRGHGRFTERENIETCPKDSSTASSLYVEGTKYLLHGENQEAGRIRHLRENLGESDVQNESCFFPEDRRFARYGTVDEQRLQK